MAVNGSVTPVVFSYTPSDVEAIVGLFCLFAPTGATGWDKFGSQTALSQGLLLEAVKGGSAGEIAVIKDNVDLASVFYKNQFGNSAVDTLGTFIGFGNAADCFSGHLPFPFPEQAMLVDSNDIIRATVRDNLSSGISALAMAVLTVSDFP